MRRLVGSNNRVSMTAAAGNARALSLRNCRRLRWGIATGKLAHRGPGSGTEPRRRGSFHTHAPTHDHDRNLFRARAVIALMIFRENWSCKILARPIGLVPFFPS